MKKETIITAVIFLAVGFLAGYITDAQMNWNGRQKAAQAAAMPSEMPPPGAPLPPLRVGRCLSRACRGSSSH